VAFQPSEPSRKMQSDRCFACGKRILLGDSQIRLYGEHYHYDCAFYRAGGAATRLSEAAVSPSRLLTGRLRAVARRTR
jgi:hypothetical protein